MEINLYVSTDEVAKWLSNNTILQNYEYNIYKLVESDANNPKLFCKLPESIRKILYLDAVDIIIEFNKKPILAVEISHEAGTGHNAFQRFARIVAAVENNVPVAYIYPEASFIHREKCDQWDKLNPNIFKALERLMQINDVPSLLFYYPSEFNNNLTYPKSSKGLINDSLFISSPNSKDSEMMEFFQYVNIILKRYIFNDKKFKLINNRFVVKRRE